MSVKLEPCPFCGGEAEGDQCRGFINYKGQSANAVAVYCTNCEAETSMCYEDFPDHTPETLMEFTIERWNKRAEASALRTQLKSLEADAVKCKQRVGELESFIVKSHDQMMTPNVNLPPLVPDGPRRKMIIEIEVSADFEKRLDNQWEVEREINSDRWSWRWLAP